MLSLCLSNPQIWTKLDSKKSGGLGVKLFLATVYKHSGWANPVGPNLHGEV